MPAFDAPGTDPTWPLQTQPNPYVGGLVQGNGIYPAAAPRRTEYYASKATGDYTAAMIWDHARNSCTISERMINPIDIMVGVPQLWRKGHAGQGIKICTLDYGWDGTTITHQCVSISGTFSTLSPGSVSAELMVHNMQVVASIAARNSGNSRIVGPAYDALMYTASGDPATCMEWARAQGCRIFTITYRLSPDAAFLEQCRLFHKEGGIVIVSAGNSSTLDMIDECCAIPNAVSVGTTLGGSVLSFVDAFYTKSVLPRGNKQLDFVLPNHTIVPGFDTNPSVGGEGADNYYRVITGTSFAPRLAGYYGLLMQRYPSLSGIEITELMKYHGRKATIDGIDAIYPDLSNIR